MLARVEQVRRSRKVYQWQCAASVPGCSAARFPFAQPVSALVPREDSRFLPQSPQLNLVCGRQTGTRGDLANDTARTAYASSLAGKNGRVPNDPK